MTNKSTLDETKRIIFEMFFWTLYWLDGLHPMAFVVQKHPAVTRKMTRNRASQKQNQCAWTFLSEAVI